MISFEEAQSAVFREVTSNRLVSVSTDRALALVLAAPVIATVPSPRFPTSAMDGYAVSLSDLNSMPREGSLLPIAGDVATGDGKLTSLKRGATLTISTGAMVPHGVDAVVMKETVRVEGTAAYFSRLPKTGENIRPIGAEYKKGATILDIGTVITPPVLGVLAALGKNTVRVFERPRVSIIITGNEVATSKAKRGQVVDTNSVALVAALRALEIADVKVYRVRDDLRRIRATVEKALQESEFTLISGGISVGDHDHVREALVENGVKEIFWRVNMKPGKPLYFGTRRHKQSHRDRYIFALPGNPVAVMVAYQLFVRPAILRSMGYQISENSRLANLRAALSKNHGRTEFVRGILSYNETNEPIVTPVKAQESYMLTGMAAANCLITLPANAQSIEAGTTVEVVPLAWSSV